MRIGHVVRSLVSGAVLYAWMAACGAAESANAPRSDGGAEGATLTDAFLDELGNPVDDAVAGPLAPLIANEPCDKDITTSGGTAGKGAIHSFPGKTVNDLSALRVIVATPGFSANGVAFDRTSGTSIFLADGAAMVACVAGTTTTFILPQ